MDDPPLRLVTGEPLTVALVGRLRANEPLRIMVERPAIRPVAVGDLIEIVRGRTARRGDIVVCRREHTCELGRLVLAAGSRVLVETASGGPRVALAADALLAVATALEQGDLLLDLSSGRWRAAGRFAAMLPPRFGPALTVLAWFERLRRPLFPPLYMGTESALLAQLAAAYDMEAEIIARETALGPEEEALVERHLAPGHRMLDVGCGAGREAVGFARAGLEVVAIDVAPTMIARARERARAEGLAIEFTVAEPLTWPAGGRAFDAIYFSPGIYSHIPGRERRVRTLAHLRDLLAPGGLIVVGPVLAPPLPVLSRARLVDLLRRIGRRCGLDRLAEPGDHYYRGHALQRAPHCHRYIHRFRDHVEAEAELAEAGLVVTERLADTCWITRAARRPAGRPAAGGPRDRGQPATMP
jgi:ubiquinone/menaquinone biosynthesis C-methylase UbiE